MQVGRRPGDRPAAVRHGAGGAIAAGRQREQLCDVLLIVRAWRHARRPPDSRGVEARLGMDGHRCPILQRPIRGAARIEPYRLRSLLACCLALLGAGQAAHARAAKAPATGGRAGRLRRPAQRDRAAAFLPRARSSAVRAIELLRQRTDWIKVRTDDGREGWVHRAQLERTLTPGGAPVQLAGPTPEARTEHHWEVGLGTGDFGGANVVAVNGAYALTPNLLRPGRRAAPARRLLQRLARSGRHRARVRAGSGACRRSSASAAAC